MNENRPDNKLNFGLLSKHRAFLMGSAIIGIVLCHLDVTQKAHNMPISKLAVLLHILTVGVDIFMLLSGLGLYYSFSSKRQSYFSFIRKRALKLWPNYFVLAGLAGLISLLLINKQGINVFIKDLFFISWVLNGSTKYWFILAIFIFYLVSPLVYKLFENITLKQGLTRLIIFFISFIVISALIDRFIPGYRRFRIAIERFPIFVCGFYLGKLSKERVRIPLLLPIIVIPIGVSATVLQLLFPPFKSFVAHTHFAYYFSRALLAFALITLLILFMEFTERKCAAVNRFLSDKIGYIGSITLEIYLLHQSFGIMFNYPYRVPMYLLLLAILPVIVACIWDKVRSIIKGANKA